MQESTFKSRYQPLTLRTPRNGAITSRGNTTEIKMGKIIESTSMRYREKVQSPVPRLNSPEITDRLSEYPLTKSDMVNYLLRLQANAENSEKDQGEFKKVMTNNKFREIFKEAQF